MDQIYGCFPGGKRKAVTLSYDDGTIFDRRLVELFNRYGLKAAFHLNSACFGESAGHAYPYVESSEVEALYRGHEIACHTHTHLAMDRSPAERNLEEILENRRELEKLCGYPVRGMSYPYGICTEKIRGAMRMCGMAYGRTAVNREEYGLPEDYLQWGPTCRHAHRLLELTDEFLSGRRNHRLSLLYVWGHSYEFERDHNWDLIETFARMTGGREDIWYATGIEIFDYMQSLDRLCFLASGKGVYNPSAAAVWISYNGTIVEAPGGKQIMF